MKKRLNIFFVVNTLIQYIVEPRCVHIVMENNMVRYLKGTIQYVLRHVRDRRICMQGFHDSDWVDNATNRKSTLGCCRKQTSVTRSTTEDEYIASKRKSREYSSIDEEYVEFYQ